MEEIIDYLEKRVYADDFELNNMYGLIMELTENKEYHEEMNDKMLSYILILLKNKNIKFDFTYLRFVLKLCTILESIEFDSDKSSFQYIEYEGIAIDSKDYCEMLTFLALDFNRIWEINDKNDLTIINILCSRALQELIHLNAYPKYDEILEELKKYNNVIYNILKQNNYYIKDYINRKGIFYSQFYNKHGYINCLEDSLLNIEQMLFLMTTEIFLSNIKTFNYKYNLISEVMGTIRKYVEENYIYINAKTIPLEELQNYIFSLLNELNTVKTYSIKH